MAQPSETVKQLRDKLVLVWFLGLLVLVLLSPVLGWFDNATELTPSHNGILTGCFVLAGLGGLLSALVPILAWDRGSVRSHLVASFAFGVMGLIAVFLVSSRAADVVEGLIDFPPARTTSRPALLLISRAYHTHGKGRSWNIQTMPIWSDLNITEDDYDFMLAHRRVTDKARNSDEISSRGYFCAQVTIEQSGDALRVMHAGSHKLPRNTVVLCP
jgi:hypothetical protein